LPVPISPWHKEGLSAFITSADQKLAKKIGLLKNSPFLNLTKFKGLLLSPADTGVLRHRIRQ
jgi:hypothetical protein